jgi:3',5'-cyclic AMP phosphodiesterase CpdA
MACSFVVLTDTHFNLPGTKSTGTWWNKTLFPRTAEIGRAMAASINRLAPDFVVHCGDFTTSGDLASFRFGKEIMDRLCCPYYMVMGNHDARQPGIRKAVAGLFGYPDDRLYYARTIKGFQFLFLDSSFAIQHDGAEDETLDWDCYHANGYAGFGPTRDQLKWLGGKLNGNKKIPTIIVSHVPMISKPAYPVGTLHKGKPVIQSPTPYNHFGGYSVYHQDLRKMINSASNVKMVLSGHWHIFDITLDNSTCYCQTGSLLEYPFEMRYIRMEDNLISLNTVSLPNSDFQKASLVKRWKNHWVAGQTRDREMSVNLN